MCVFPKSPQKSNLKIILLGSYEAKKKFQATKQDKMSKGISTFPVFYEIFL